MIVFLLKDFIRSRSLMAGIVILLLTGLTSIYVGGLFLERQQDTMAQAATAQRESIEHTLSHVADDDLGLFLYYARFGLVNELPRLAGLSVGHRDVHPAAQNVNIRNLEEQRHVSALRNPLYQLLGNLDFSFVLVFLFPLVIIGFCFNLFSEERERGTWSLVLGQAERPEQVLRQKLLLRYAAVQLTLLFLVVVAVFYLEIPVDAYLQAFVAVAVLYLSFWFSLAWLVIRLRRASSTNALMLLLSWVMLAIVLPGALNALVVALYPVPEAYEAMLESRDGYHNKWDEAKEPTIARFKEIYPRFAKYEHPEGANFGWFWYYAMQHLGDEEASAAKMMMREKLEQRSWLSKAVGTLLPSVHAQLSLTTLARADLTNYLAYQDRLAAFHEAKRLAFYPQIFENEAVSAVDWQAHQTDYFKDDRRVNWLVTLLPLLLASVLLLGVARLVGVPYTAR